MTPRQGLCVALVGLIIAVGCWAPAYFFDSGLILYGFAGFVVMIVGLVMAGIATFVGSSRFLVGDFHSFSSMQVKIFRRKYSSSR